ncbi:hypothetical protein Patl1_33503 [Pistacia atlantica]|uniref:Uncharacterized protein n=1 Tax=Pistacia atlantica TaxID=434234 RepID=A0ACC0ZSY3_9ROSI|nr:hypothetical protein Patl1_33503 [Pistacia atlantica]
MKRAMDRIDDGLCGKVFPVNALEEFVLFLDVTRWHNNHTAFNALAFISQPKAFIESSCLLGYINAIKHFSKHFRDKFLVNIVNECWLYPPLLLMTPFSDQNNAQKVFER